MKILLSGFLILALSVFSFGQAPQSFSYQAIARDASGNGISNQNIGLRISILQNSITGTSVYTETHTALTDANGVLNLAIGTGTVTTGTFSSINWGEGTYFVKIEMDVTGGTNYVLMGTSQLLSVPYALYAGGVNLSKNNRLQELYIGDDGIVYSKPKIVVEKPYSLTPTVTDASGNTYGTVKIGTQVWMTENLRTTKYNDGTQIPNVISATDWINLTTPGMCTYNNTVNTDTIMLFGRLYNGYAVQTNKLCPTGWHMPTKTEFEVFITYLGAVGAARIRSDLHWSSNFYTINDAGFDAYEAGYRGFYGPGEFGLVGTTFWSSTLAPEIDNNRIYALPINSGSYTPYIGNGYFTSGLSVRCLKD